MSHAPNKHELRIRDRCGRILATGGQKERVITSMNDQRRRGHGRKSRPTVARDGDRRELTSKAKAVMGPAKFLQEETTGAGLVERVALASDPTREGKAMLQVPRFV